MVASAAEVAVDPDTGEVEILNFIIADDVGRVCFLKGVKGQCHGGLEVMQGEAFLYEQILDPPTGATLNPHYIDRSALLRLIFPLTSIRCLSWNRMMPAGLTVPRVWVNPQSRPM